MRAKRYLVIAVTLIVIPFLVFFAVGNYIYRSENSHEIGQLRELLRQQESLLEKQISGDRYLTTEGAAGFEELKRLEQQTKSLMAQLQTSKAEAQFTAVLWGAGAFLLMAVIQLAFLLPGKKGGDENAADIKADVPTLD